MIALNFFHDEAPNSDDLAKPPPPPPEMLDQWKETTRDKYEEMLDVLPPADYNRTFTAFLVGEPCDHDESTGRPRYEAFQIRDGRYWYFTRPMTRTEFRKVCR